MSIGLETYPLHKALRISFHLYGRAVRVITGYLPDFRNLFDLFKDFKPSGLAAVYMEI